MMAISIRAAQAADKDVLGALKLQASLAWGDHVEKLHALPEASEVPAAHLPHAILAELEGKIVGFATVFFARDTFQAELEDLFVAPEAWRKGVGRMLLSEAENRAAVLGARTLHVVAGKRARPFYEASGYHFVATVTTDLEPGAELKKDLP